MLLLFAYSLGLAVPFLISAIAIERFTVFFQKMRKQMMWISRISGAVMIVIGVMLVTNYFTVLASWLTTLTPEFLLERI
jgi:cytochrome c-type biogenesis protein